MGAKIFYRRGSSGSSGHFQKYSSDDYVDTI